MNDDDLITHADEAGITLEQAQEYIRCAREDYCCIEDPSVHIDDDARFSVGDDGVWVSAWVWIPRREGD